MFSIAYVGILQVCVERNIAWMVGGEDGGVGKNTWTRLKSSKKNFLLVWRLNIVKQQLFVES